MTRQWFAGTQEEYMRAVGETPLLVYGPERAIRPTVYPADRVVCAGIVSNDEWYLGSWKGSIAGELLDIESLRVPDATCRDRLEGELIKDIVAFTRDRGLAGVVADLPASVGMQRVLRWHRIPYEYVDGVLMVRHEPEK